jgi:phage shock protein C
MNMPEQRLLRSRREKILGGVAGGIGQYVHVDPVIIRIVFFLLTLYGVGPLVYLILWVVMPIEPVSSGAQPWNSSEQQSQHHAFVRGMGAHRVRSHAMSSQPADPDADPEEEIHIRNLDSDAENPQMRTTWILGAGLVVLGVFLVLRSFIPGLAPLLVPILLIGAGVYILYRNNEQ